MQVVAASWTLVGSPKHAEKMLIQLITPTAFSWPAVQCIVMICDLVLVDGPHVGVLHGEGGDLGDLVQADQPGTEDGLHPFQNSVSSRMKTVCRQQTAKE